MISIVATDDLFDAQMEATLLRRVHDALAAAIDATDDPRVSSLIGVTLQTIPVVRFFTGGRPQSAVRIDVALPAIALSTFRRRRAFIRDATKAVIECANAADLAERVSIRITHLVDGGWGSGRRGRMTSAGCGVRRTEGPIDDRDRQAAPHVS